MMHTKHNPTHEKPSNNRKLSNKENPQLFSPHPSGSHITAVMRRGRRVVICVRGLEELKKDSREIKEES